MKSLIIFAGSGASRGVSEKYPTTVEFRKQLPAEIAKSPMLERLTDHFQAAGQKVIDIEHVLLELGRFRETLYEWVDEKNFPAHLLKTNLISNIQQSASNSGPATHDQFRLVLEKATKLQHDINERVYEFYAKDPEPSELERSWLPLFRLVAEEFRKDQLAIFTTNYDLVIEHAIEATEGLDIDRGYVEGIYPKIGLERWQCTPEKWGLFTKLHGSVDWELGQGGTDKSPVIRRGHLEFRGNHDHRLILYPGFKGTPTSEPFASFHEYLGRTVRAATHILFIGYAFRDEYINTKLGGASLSVEVAVIDPMPKLPTLPFLAKAIHFKSEFGTTMEAPVSMPRSMEPLRLEDLRQWLRT